MNSKVTSALVCAVFLAGAGQGIAQGKKSSSSTPKIDVASLEVCPGDASGVETSVMCRCESGGALGSVWGSGPYTADSSVCSAATHAGVIGIDGGGVTITKPACTKMPGGAETHECSCAADTASGSVWGSSPYTDDSDLCTAARHAGYIGGEGGDIFVIRVAGLAAYAGSENEGETTRDWGSHSSSVVFDWNK